MSASFVSPDVIRRLFAQAMSRMYRTEVPLYGTLVELVERINAQVLAQDPALAAQLQRNDERARLDEERHGAIRVGTAEELATLRRLFAVMGMYPVGYYDLSVAGCTGALHRVPAADRRGAGAESVPRVHLAAAPGADRRPSPACRIGEDSGTPPHLHRRCAGADRPGRA